MGENCPAPPIKITKVFALLFVLQIDKKHSDAVE
jgi:hypothetical protein